jgi:hypothetical protein
MTRRATAYSAHQRVDAEPTLSSREQVSAVDAEITASPSERGSFAAFQMIFNRAYNQFYVSHDVNVDLKRTITENEITILEFEKLTLTKQYQRYITLEEGRIRFDEIPMRPHGEIAAVVNSIVARQVEGVNFMDGLEGAMDNGILFNCPNGHRLQTQ